MNSISQKLVEANQRIREEIKYCSRCEKIKELEDSIIQFCDDHTIEVQRLKGEIKGVAETCEAILKDTVDHAETYGCEAHHMYLMKWLETEIKILKESKLV